MYSPTPSPVPTEPKQITTVDDMKDYLRSLAGDDFAILDAIATCESRWRMVWNFMYEKRPDYYTAYGIFQITRGTAQSTDPTLDRMTIEGNIELAVKLYKKSGTRPWNESRSCWQSKVLSGTITP